MKKNIIYIYIINININKMTNKRPREEETIPQNKLTYLPIELIKELILPKVPQLRFVSKIFFDATKGWSLLPGAEYPLLTNKYMKCVTHIQNSFSGQVMIPCPEEYFNNRTRSYQMHNGKDPRHMSKVTCFHCLETKPQNTFFKKVKAIPGNYYSVISCCSEKCNNTLNKNIHFTDVPKLKNKEIKIPSLGESYEDVKFHLASVIPQSDGKILSYYLQGTRVNSEEICVWASIDKIKISE